MMYSTPIAACAWGSIVFPRVWFNLAVFKLLEDQNWTGVINVGRHQG
jgi:hypothetical protein